MKQLVIPSNIPWNDLKGTLLEELVFWLLDDMGAKDLEWRKGGSTVNSPDGGRDIEASFHVPTPDGEMDKQRWWIEVKGRSNTIESTVVHEAVLNAAGKSFIDVLVIVTNTQFSNPTRDWVREWQENNPRPKVRLWDKDSLERMVVKHPSVVARICPEALSDQGRLEALTTRFWNQLYFPSVSDLEHFWKQDVQLEWSMQSVLAILAGEIVNGNIEKRPWLIKINPDDLAELVVLAVVNTAPLWYKAVKFGIDAESIIKMTSYIIMFALIHLPFDVFSKIVNNPWSFIEGRSISEEARNYILKPILWRIKTELGDVCSDGCTRISTDPLLLLDDFCRDNYLRRFVPPESCKEPFKDRDSRTLIIEAYKEPCNVGLALDENINCPLFTKDDLPLIEQLKFFREILITKIQGIINQEA